MGAASGNCEVFYTVEFRLSEEDTWHEFERVNDHDDAVSLYKDRRKRSSSPVEWRLVRWAGTVVSQQPA